MKLLIITSTLALAVLSIILVFANRDEDQNGKTALDITWDGPYALQVPSGKVTADVHGNKSLTIRPQLADEYSNFDATIVRIQNPPVSCRFALQGTVSYTNLPDNSALELTSCSVVKTQTITTNEDAGPQKHLLGTSAPRPFVITFAGLPGDGKMLQLDLSVFVGGHPVEDPASKGQPTSITLSNLKLVRFPDPTPEDLGLTSYSGSNSGQGLDWKSFCVGVTTTAVLALAMAQAILLVRRLKKMRAEREMRRIASLDS
jgi:hypothetical protein